MTKPEWGTKRTCPKCGERFYDLQKPVPLKCVACGVTFEPEVVLKSKQPMPEQPVKKPKKVVKEAEDDDDLDDIEIDDDDDDDVIEDDLDDDDDDEVKVVVPKRSSGADES